MPDHTIKKPASDLGAASRVQSNAKECSHHTPNSEKASSVKLDGRFGAYPSDWQHFSETLGLMQDLLPVVSNKGAAISPTSRLKALGKTPSCYDSKGETIGILKWPQKQATSADITKWSKQKDYGLCVNTRKIRAVDADIGDFEEAVDVEAFIRERLGIKLQVRRRNNSTKFLTPFIIPGDDLTKRRFKTKTKGSFIELLACGQQFVAIGEHPSGERYSWDNGLPDVIPELSRDEFEALWSALNEKFGSEKSVTTHAGSPDRDMTKNTDGSVYDLVVDYLYEKGLVTDVTASGDICIDCPEKHLHSSDNGPSETVWQPAVTNGYAVGHYKCMHESCKTKISNDRDFLEAIGYSIDGFEVIEVPTSLPLPDFGKRTRDGKIEPTRGNLTAAMARPDLCGYYLRFDTFLDDIVVAKVGDGMEEGRFKEKLHLCDLAIRLESGTNGFKHIPTATLREAFFYTCEKQVSDKAQDWLSGLTWDGVPRVASFLSRYAGAADSDYTRAASLYWWSALAGRIIQPGVKADMALIAVGEQGMKKSTLVEAMVPEETYAGELDLKEERTEIARSMRGKMVMELGELSGFSKRSVEHIKAFISRRKEEWARKYEEFTSTLWRRCLFFGTTNNDEVLPDETGNRRWLPFRSSGADPVGLAAVRDQLWAEGAYLFKKNGVMWQDAERLAKDEHAEFAVTDPWDRAVHDWLYTPADVYDEKTKSWVPGTSRPADSDFENSEVLSGAVHLDTRDQTKAYETRMGKILIRFGFERVQLRIKRAEQTTDGRTHRWVYRRKAGGVTTV